MSPALIAMLPFFGALLPGLLIRSGRSTAALASGATSLLALIGLCLHIPAILRGEVITAQFNWLPMIQLHANFRIDGLSLLFGILILGIGLLIITYAHSYLSRRDSIGKFYTYLMLFQGAMMGIVLSDNILLLLIFWELTSLSSFLLIGYWRHLPEGRQGARMALAVTGTGGLAMIAGMLFLGNIAGSYDISGILEAKEAIQASPYYSIALILILLGAFTKSAQFPFHFWLPHAMAAPTPVSAYLHSATMVKAGLFLMARLWPVLSGTPEWFWIVSTIGLITMVLGAVIATFKDDLKALLAFSTVSHLGLVTMLLGFGTEAAAVAAVFHIINHATFKAALFMTAGIVDHGTHTRLISRLGGLRKLMPITFVIGTIASLSMAGIPPLNGFISKEMMLYEVSHLTEARQTFMVIATLAAMFSVCYSLRLIVQVFLGPQRDDYPHHPHDPGFGMWMSPALLVVLVILIGLFPNYMAGWLVNASASAVTGTAQHVHLALWHGVNAALIMSGIAIIGGIVLLGLHRPLLLLWNALPRPEAKSIYDSFVNLCVGIARGLTDSVNTGSMPRALAAFTLVTVLTGAYAWYTGNAGPATRPMLPIQPVPFIGWVMAIVATAGVVAYHRIRLLALILLSIIGLVTAGFFLYFSAPDLALTQAAVEVVTIVLLLLALNFLPKRTSLETSPPRRSWDAFIATLAGVGFGALTYAMLRRDFAFPSISEYMVANSYKGGGGSNIVNVILVDFRGYDTFGEITVLGIAALAIFALTEAMLAGRAGSLLRGWVYEERRAGDRHPQMLVVITRILLPLALTVAVYLLLRGHNLPGGGFVAGLVVSVALVMQYMASGAIWTQSRQPIPYHALIGLGVIAAGLTGIGAWFAGVPFLTSAFGYFKLPFIEEIELATAMGFDLGVFLCVVGAVMLTLHSLSRLTFFTGTGVVLDEDSRKEVV